jgi:aerobic-type carbon monoxide dehydrogenase small subunit (CoxS/CutS family)
VTPVAAVQSMKIHTVEGLPVKWANEQGLQLSKTTLHPVQQAWIDEQVPQCSYCQSGMMINAVALLEGIKKPSEQQIRVGMNGHLCRCGTHLRIISAVKRASAAMA